MCYIATSSLHLNPVCVFNYRSEEVQQVAAVQQLSPHLSSSIHIETLVLYIHSNTDPEYERNMRFFVQHGMAAGDGCEYVIIVQQVSVACARVTFPLRVLCA